MGGETIKPNVLVVGCGMYTCGAGSEDYGTVLPTLIQLQKNREIGKIYVAARRKSSVDSCKKKVKTLNKKLGFTADVTFYPKEKKTDEKAYLEAAKNIEKPACAIIVVPDHLHAPITEQLIDMKFHCLVVKPLTPTINEAKKLITKAKKHNLQTGVEFHKRFDQANKLLKKTIKEKTLGDLLYILVEFSQRRSIPLNVFKSWTNKSNVFQYLGVHYIDLIYYLTNAKPVRVMATGQQSLLKSHKVETFDSIQAVVEWQLPSKKKFTSILSTNWIDPERTTAMSDQKIKVIGSKGRYESDQKNRGVQLVTDKGVEDINPYFSKMYLDTDDKYYISGYGPNSITQFILDTKKHMSGKKVKTEVPTFNDALISTAVIEAVDKSLRDNSTWIEIDKSLIK